MENKLSVKRTKYSVEGAMAPCIEVSNTDNFIMVRIAPYYHLIGPNTLYITEYIDGEYNGSDEWDGDFNALSDRDAISIAKRYSVYL